MGFAEYAIEVIKRNRKLQKSISKKYFLKSTEASKSKSKYYGLEFKFSEEDYLKARRKKRIHLLKQFGLFAIIFIGILTFVMTRGDKAIVGYVTKYNNRLSLITQKEMTKDDINLYHYWLENGQQHLQNEQWTLARVDFQKALKIYATGKKANLGLAESLIMVCKEDETNCSEASDYYTFLINNFMLDGEEKSLINKLYNH